jgi:F0F1-type ATP synthase assembly protein I
MMKAKLSLWSFVVGIDAVAGEVSYWFSSSVFFFSATGDEVLLGHHTVSNFWDI